MSASNAIDLESPLPRIEQQKNGAIKYFVFV